ncbi:hypothetical protein AAA799P11_00009 [Marine Group I thaumarchaeote SCGC AAA799-P11]|uniref:Uncharacterized protein n=3 Tax=Marine Group I TaxID=905826 RepID=A0A087S3F8_9ARCH|nr:hypothetical protein AAA799N04_01558 [Marine Group I thaumarchaeote SCGC AAA799-N04]KFM15688.1 hypothetical protein SCCGRSA3_02625 [Marine Group I thaumarchaeote SCGC RSA3]KFM20262.1 hypothetical protein AAA799P11_00009 [Marine Group I thaumarchaeote SCGC AAA799-P11]
MMNATHIFTRKSNLFTIVLAAVIGLLATPVIIPHVLHGYHMIHIGIHIAGITLSVFLSILAIIAYKNLRTNKMLFTLISFLVFVAAEIVTLVDATWPTMYDLEYMTLSEVGHILILITLGMLSLGVFRND